MTDDAQSRAFREARPADRVPDDELAGYIESVHNPLTHLGEIRLPHQWDADGWDAERTGPKSVPEAREQLARRIADPSAPDGDEVARAYDDIEDGHR